ncbi:hypothetical protein [Streptomyces sp. XD-27]|uniref:hypothetical protein n=1 Tax=Streptomyces sp. XD-27 TaxID=3062779 RepID=UPI0026F43407|nr:hypothetical protein [Streptomyces sp. XD-27]WKX68607.1 hypothetical protein Q3Y56_00350 [Streptomyces sp. XD-27]
MGEVAVSGRPRLRVAGALVGVTASVLTWGLAVVTVVLVPAWWPHPAVVVVAGLLLLGVGFALIAVCFIRLGPWHFGVAAIVECLLAVGLLMFLDQAVLDVWGERLETVVTKAVRHERTAPTGKVTGVWWECSLERLDGTELERNLRESDFVPLGRRAPPARRQETGSWCTRCPEGSPRRRRTPLSGVSGWLSRSPLPQQQRRRRSRLSE